MLAVGGELEAGGVGDGVADREGLPPGAVVLVAGEATANVRVPVRLGSQVLTGELTILSVGGLRECSALGGN